MTSSPGSICTISHQVLCHPAEHGTRSMGKQLLPKGCITKLNELTESEVTTLPRTMVYETVLAIMRRQESQGIATVSSQRQFIFDIQV